MRDFDTMKQRHKYVIFGLGIAAAIYTGYSYYQYRQPILVNMEFILDKEAMIKTVRYKSNPFYEFLEIAFGINYRGSSTSSWRPEMDAITIDLSGIERDSEILTKNLEKYNEKNIFKACLQDRIAYSILKQIEPSKRQALLTKEFLKATRAHELAHARIRTKYPMAKRETICMLEDLAESPYMVIYLAKIAYEDQFRKDEHRQAAEYIVKELNRHFGTKDMEDLLLKGYFDKIPGAAKEILGVFLNHQGTKKVNSFL